MDRLQYSFFLLLPLLVVAGRRLLCLSIAVALQYHSRCCMDRIVLLHLSRCYRYSSCCCYYCCCLSLSPSDRYFQCIEYTRILPFLPPHPSPSIPPPHHHRSH